MSYLHSPRLVFTGDFQADVSTINNNTSNFDINSYEPGTNGSWNPEGGAVFNFLNCAVQRLVLEDGTVQNSPDKDVVIGQVIAGAVGRPTGKLVDLDPDMQTVSELWCVKLRICTPDQELLLQGDIATAPFRDLQVRYTAGKGSQSLGAAWTTVLTNLVWGDLAGKSSFLQNLQAVTQENKLSINLSTFGYYARHEDGRFSLGKIIGTIGPWFSGEPETFAPARRLYGINSSNTFSFSNFLFQADKKKLTVDFSNSFPVADPLGSVNYTGPLLLGISKKPITFLPDAANSALYLSQEDIIPIGSLNYQNGPAWLSKTGGIADYNNLPDAVAAALEQNQLLLLAPMFNYGDTPVFQVVAREAAAGLLVRADNFVQRLNCNETVGVNFFAYQWGKPLPGANLTLELQPIVTGSGGGPTYNNVPANGLTMAPVLPAAANPAAAQTDANGKTAFNITGNAINTPRIILDGQIYNIAYTINGEINEYNVLANTPDYVFIHLYDAFEVVEEPAWDDIKDIMIQYSNLYPIMSKYLVNLSDPVALWARRETLDFAFSYEIDNSMHMPVTRDLSDAKRQTILNWLRASEMKLHHPAGIAEKQLLTASLKQKHSDAAATPTQGQMARMTALKNGTLM